MTTTIASAPSTGATDPVITSDLNINNEGSVALTSQDHTSNHGISSELKGSTLCKNSDRTIGTNNSNDLSDIAPVNISESSEIKPIGSTNLNKDNCSPKSSNSNPDIINNINNNINDNNNNNNNNDSSDSTGDSGNGFNNLASNDHSISNTNNNHKNDDVTIVDVQPSSSPKMSPSKNENFNAIDPEHKLSPRSAKSISSNVLNSKKQNIHLSEEPQNVKNRAKIDNVNNDEKINLPSDTLKQISLTQVSLDPTHNFTNNPGIDGRMIETSSASIDGTSNLISEMSSYQDVPQSIKRENHGGKSNSTKSENSSSHSSSANNAYGSYQQHHNRSSHHNQHHNHHINQVNNQPNQHQTHTNRDQLSRTNLYIRGLSADTSDSDLFSMCSRFGSIVSTKAILDKNTNKCKGYGFVDFETPASAELAVIELQKQGILVHMAKQQEADPTNLYIANLPQMITESELENLLQPFGRVVSTRILMNQNRQPRGVGFARMENKEQCDAIIASLNGRVVKDSKEPLLVKFADGASKKKVHHYQHKQLGPNSFVNDHMWRNNNSENNYHLMNSGQGGRNFHPVSFDHSRQNHTMPHLSHNQSLSKHHPILSSMPNYHSHQQVSGHHQHSSTGGHHNHQQHHQAPMHHNNHSSHTNHRNQNQGPYSSGSNFPMSSSMSGGNDNSQWLHQPQAGQPYVLQAQMMAATPAVDPSLHYVNITNQMQGLQIGNPAVGGYISPQQWPMWPGSVGAKPTGASQDSNHVGNHAGYTETD